MPTKTATPKTTATPDLPAETLAAYRTALRARGNMPDDQHDAARAAGRKFALNPDHAAYCANLARWRLKFAPLPLAGSLPLQGAAVAKALLDATGYVSDRGASPGPWWSTRGVGGNVMGVGELAATFVEGVVEVVTEAMAAFDAEAAK